MPNASVTPLLTMEAANIYCGVQEPNDVLNSNHLRLTDVKLPGMDEQYSDHRAAGAPIAIEIDTFIARLECTFTLAGWTSQVATLLAQWGPAVNQYWVYGAMRDRVTGDILQARAAIYGRLARADPQLWRRGDVSHWAYSIRCITKYTLRIKEDGDNIYQWDYFANIFNVGGNPITSKVNAALNLINVTNDNSAATPTGG
jgi:P2 family phage contractile tail tube protein